MKAFAALNAAYGQWTKKLYHCGFRGKVSRGTLADANESRDWRIYRDFAQRLIVHAKKLYAGEDFGVELAVKLHALLDLRGNIPTFVHITEVKCMMLTCMMLTC